MLPTTRRWPLIRTPTNRILLAAVAAAAFSVRPACSAMTSGDYAVYSVIPSVERTTPPVSQLRLTALEPESEADGACWRMDVTKQDGRVFTVWCSSEKFPLAGGSGSVGKVRRYLLRPPGGVVLEYRDTHTGGALLPRQPFDGVLLPGSYPPTQEGWPEQFQTGGSYLGHSLVLQSRGTAEPESMPTASTTISIDPTLSIGTSRNFKDDGTPRKSVDDEYVYVPFDKQDYDRLIEAGHTYFMGLAREQLSWIIDRPAYFQASPESNDLTGYPEIMYRSNWWGMESFYDEPAVRFGWQAPAGTDASHPEALANAVMMRVRALAKDGPRSGNNRLQQHLSSRVALGTLELREPDKPVWETYYDTACYQYMGGAHALIHEGRYNLRDIEWLAERLLGRGLSPTPDELLRFHFSFLRGAARVFGGEWGMSVYGQTEPTLEYPSMQTAYDMGATYIWFWSSDHDHHLPFADQVRHATALKRYARTSPKRDMEALKRKAVTAIVLPFGYTMSPGQWAGWSMQAGYLNGHGETYRDIPAAALHAWFREIRSGRDVDIVVDHERVREAGYQRLIHVYRDGHTHVVEDGKPIVMPRSSVSGGTLTVGSAPVPARRMPEDAVALDAEALGTAPDIDGDLTDWQDAQWTPLSVHAFGTAVSTEDCSASFAVRSSGDSLDIAVKVRDDVHHAPFSGWDMWQGDCVQIALDPLGQRSSDGYDWDDHELGFALTPQGPKAFRWDSPARDPSLAGVAAALASGPMDGFPMAAQRDQARKLTIYEASVPYTRLWPLAIGSGNWVGFNIVVNDADGGQGTDGPGLRESAVALTPGLAGPKMPSEFVALRLPERNSAGEWASMFTLPRNVFESTILNAAVECVLNCPSPSPLIARLVLLDDSGKVAGSWMAGGNPEEGLQNIRLELRQASIGAGRYTLQVSLESRGRTVAHQAFRLFVLPRQ